MEVGLLYTEANGSPLKLQTKMVSFLPSFSILLRDDCCYTGPWATLVHLRCDSICPDTLLVLQQPRTFPSQGSLDTSSLPYPCHVCVMTLTLGMAQAGLC